MPKYAFPSNHSENFPPVGRIFVLWFGTVDISIIARRMTLKPEEEERLDMDQAEQIIKEAVASLGKGLDQVLRILHRNATSTASPF